MLDFIQLANRKELRTVKSSEVNELCMVMVTVSRD